MGFKILYLSFLSEFDLWHHELQSFHPCSIRVVCLLQILVIIPYGWQRDSICLLVHSFILSSSCKHLLNSHCVPGTWSGLRPWGRTGDHLDLSGMLDAIDEVLLSSFIASSIHTLNVGLNQTPPPSARPGERPKLTHRSRALERVRPECGLGNHCSRFVPGVQKGMRLPGERVRSRGTQRWDLQLRCLCWACTEFLGKKNKSLTDI